MKITMHNCRERTRPMTIDQRRELERLERRRDEVQGVIDELEFSRAAGEPELKRTLREALDIIEAQADQIGKLLGVEVLKRQGKDLEEFLAEARADGRLFDD